MTLFILEYAQPRTAPYANGAIIHEIRPFTFEEADATEAEKTADLFLTEGAVQGGDKLYPRLKISLCPFRKLVTSSPRPSEYSLEV